MNQLFHKITFGLIDLGLPLDILSLPLEDRPCYRGAIKPYPISYDARDGFIESTNATTTVVEIPRALWNDKTDSIHDSFNAHIKGRLANTDISDPKGVLVLRGTPTVDNDQTSFEYGFLVGGRDGTLVVGT